MVEPKYQENGGFYQKETARAWKGANHYRRGALLGVAMAANRGTRRTRDVKLNAKWRNYDDYDTIDVGAKKPFKNLR